MACRVMLSNGRLVVEDQERLLKGRHNSQMAVWGLQYDAQSSSYLGTRDDQGLVEKVTGYFSRAQIPYELSQEVEQVKEELESQHRHLATALGEGARFKRAEPVSGEL